MTTVYTYDSRNRLSKIEHKDGQTAWKTTNPDNEVSYCSSN
jgi:hypothetical protein